MNKSIYLNLLLAIICMGLNINVSGQQTSTRKTTTVNKNTAPVQKGVVNKTSVAKNASAYNTHNEVGGIQWLSFEEAVEKMKTEPKKMFIDVYTTWCGPCKMMDRNTFKDKEVIEYMNKNYYSVKLDAESTETIQFNGRDFEFVPSGRKGYHQLAYAILQGKLSFPSLVFVDNIGEVIELALIAPGYHPPEDFKPLIHFVGEDAHLSNVPYADFAAKFKMDKK